MTEGPEEPLVESAPFTQVLARTLCTRDAASGETCAWYHGVWQYLRVLGLAKTCGGQAEFFVETLRGFARAGSWARVLVTGSGDYSMPAHALFAYEREGATAALTVLDLCETPLALSRWYAERRGAVVATARHDILGYESASPFDAVMTNSFLGYFDPAVRPRLVVAWRRLLRQGGKVIFTNRLRPAAAGISPIGFSTDEAHAFRATARREAERWRAVLGVDPDEVAGWAGAYAERFSSYPVHSADEIASLLRDAGFSVDYLEVVTTPALPGGSVALSGPSTAGRADYARVIATRL